MAFLLALQGAAAQGLAWSILALGAYISFRLLDFPDMTMDGAFTLGACVSAVAIVAGLPPLFALILAFLAGAGAGGVTGLLHTKLGIPAILAGILTQIGLYSVNLRILGRANQPFLQLTTLYKQVQDGLARFGLSLSTDQAAVLLGLLLAFGVVAFLYWFFGTEIGSAIRATGNNAEMVRALGQSTDQTMVLALCLSNAWVGFAGGLVAMYQGAADVGMGAGAIVIGLASIVIGETILPHVRAFGSKLSAVVLGSILYRAMVALVLQLGLHTNDMKLLTALLVVLALYLPQVLAVRRGKREGHHV